jgi:CheY-like chemotaxis protein
MTKKRAPANHGRDAPPLVLVVDDFEDNRAMYVEYLQFHGFRVVDAVNGEDAVLRTRELLPAVIVMDLSLPVMDGWEATRQIKADPKTAHIRVIALTGHAEPAHAKKALDAGCDDLVVKPCLPENLLAKIREHLPASDARGSRGEGEQSGDGEPGGLVSAGTGRRPKEKR